MVVDGIRNGSDVCKKAMGWVASVAVGHSEKIR